MGRSISAADADRSFAQILREVRAGSSLIMTVKGRPVARIVPFKPDADARRAARARLFERLQAQPAINLGPWTREELYERPSKAPLSR